MCNYPSEDFGYCKKCDLFWAMPPNNICHEHSTKLEAFKAVTINRRIANYILDDILISIISLLIIMAFKTAIKSSSFNTQTTATGQLETMKFWFQIIYLFMSFFYYFIFETLWQRTPAKFITGTKVITYSGEKPSTMRILFRTLLRFVPFEQLSFGKAKVRGWHDKWSGTYVIRKPLFRCATIAPFSRELLREKTCFTAIISFGLSMILPTYFIGFILSSIFSKMPFPEESYGGHSSDITLYVLLLYVLAYVLSLILGVLSLRKIKRSDGFLDGKGLAWAGTIISSLVLIISFTAFAIAFVYLSFTVKPMPLPEAQVDLTKYSINSLNEAVIEFQREKGRYPTENEGLKVLLKQSSDESASKKKEGTDISSLVIDFGYIRPEYKKARSFKYQKSLELPKDGWGRDLIYKYTSSTPVPFLIMSFGADGQEGGEGYNKDIMVSPIKEGRERIKSRKP